MSTTAVINKPSANTISFPCACSTCGKMVETRHGLANESAVSQGEPALCRTCHRNRRPDLPRERRPAVVDSWQSNADPSQPTSPVPVRLSPAIANPTPAERCMLEHLEECVARDIQWLDLKTGMNVTVLAKTAEVRSSVGVNLHELDRSSNSANYQLRTYDLCSPRGMQTAKLTFVLLPESADSVTPEFLTELLPQIGIRSGASQSDSLNELHHYYFVCSHQGFDSRVIRQLQSQPAPAWYLPNVSLYLHDIQNRHTSFREADLTAYNLSDLLQRSGTTQQFQRAVEWLRMQLPLAASISSSHIAAELKLETDAVEAAMRCVAVQKKLRLETTANFGLVMSEPGLKNNGTHASEPARRWYRPILDAVATVIHAPVLALQVCIRWMRGRKTR